MSLVSYERKLNYLHFDINFNEIGISKHHNLSQKRDFCNFFRNIEFDQKPLFPIYQIGEVPFFVTFQIFAHV